MENVFLVKIQRNVNQRTYTITFRRKFLTQLKSRILTIKIGVIFSYKDVFLFARLNRILYFFHKALYHEYWPRNMKLETISHSRTLYALVRQ